MLDERVRDRIIAETRGNPLALLELPRGLTADAAGRRVRAARRRRRSRGGSRRATSAGSSALPEDARRLLLVAAAEPVGDPLLLWRAAERLGIAAAVDGGATRRAAGDRRAGDLPPSAGALGGLPVGGARTERRAAHLALAEATDRDADPDRRAWHLAAAAAGPDEEVALELERSAGRAQARGGLAAAAAFLQRAVALTGDPARRAERALAAAEASLQAGAFDAALGLLATARGRAARRVPARPRGPAARPGRLRLRAAAATLRRCCCEAAKRLEPLDPRLARETYLDAWGAALFAGRLATAGGLLEVSRAARAGPPARRTLRARPTCCSTGLRWLFTDGRAAAAPVLERAATRVRGERRLGRGGAALGLAGDRGRRDASGTTTTLARRLDARQSSSPATPARSRGSPITSTSLGAGRRARRRLRAARQLVAEADSVTEATGTRIAPYAALRAGRPSGPGGRGRRR